MAQAQLDVYARPSGYGNYQQPQYGGNSSGNMNGGFYGGNGNSGGNTNGASFFRKNVQPIDMSADCMFVPLGKDDLFARVNRYNSKVSIDVARYTVYKQPLPPVPVYNPTG